MAALLRRLAEPRRSSTLWLAAIIPAETHGRAPRLDPRDGLAHSRGQHTEAAAPAEVDLKRLDGDDDGRDTREMKSDVVCPLHG